MKDFKLDTIPKIKTGFVLPDDLYFENLTKKVNSKIMADQIKIIPLYQKQTFWFQAIAAVFVLGFFVSIYQHKFEQKPMTADDYVVTDTNISTEEIAEQLTEDDIANLEKNLIDYEQVSIEHIENYL